MKQGLRIDSSKAQLKGKDPENGQKIVRMMRQQPITLYTCNANHITNKMPTMTTCKENLDVIHITEAGLKQKFPDVMKAFKNASNFLLLI